MKQNLFYLIAIVAILFTSCTKNEQQATESTLKLWYTQPAQDWFDYLPMGNGRIAAMISGA